jgi:hypothetical protein
MKTVHTGQLIHGSTHLTGIATTMEKAGHMTVLTGTDFPDMRTIITGIPEKDQKWQCRWLQPDRLPVLE